MWYNVPISSQNCFSQTYAIMLLRGIQSYGVVRDYVWHNMTWYYLLEHNYSPFRYFVLFSMVWYCFQFYWHRKKNFMGYIAGVFWPYQCCHTNTILTDTPYLTAGIVNVIKICVVATLLWQHQWCVESKRKQGVSSLQRKQAIVYIALITESPHSRLSNVYSKACI